MGFKAISDVPGQLFYIMAYFLSCVLEKKNSPMNLDFY